MYRTTSIGLDNPTYLNDEQQTNGTPAPTQIKTDLHIQPQKLNVNDNNNENDVNNIEDDSPQRDAWGKSIEFLMSCIAMSVGLGNVWRFPFTALENGGGAFLIPYLIVLLLVGRPIYYLEMILGQFSSRGSVKVYDFSPVLKGVGYGQIIAIAIVSPYYASLMATTLRYFVASFSSVLPWSICQDDWTNCLPSTQETTNTSIIPKMFNNETTSSAELYFLKNVLNEKDTIHDGIGLPDWKLFLCLMVSWTIVLLLLIKGVKSSGKASYFLALFPYVVMGILLIRAVTLPGAIDGIIYFIKPQWDQILNPKVWYAAVTQCFFSLSVCFGNIIMYSSYNKFSHNVYRDANIVTSIDTATSLLAGFTIFGILGHLAHEVGSDDVGSVVKGGPGLAFISYPEAIAKFEFIPQLFAVLFFLMLFVLGLGSNVAMASSIMTIIRDAFPKIKHWHASLMIAAVGLSVGSVYVTPGGQYILNLVDYFGASFVVLVLAIAELIAVAWIYGVDRLCKDIEFMLNRKTGLYWRICWGIVTPLLMIIILIYSIATMTPLQYKDYIYPDSVYAFGWCISALGLIQLPIWAFYAFLKQPGDSIIERITESFRPEASWGPLSPSLLEKYKIYMSQEMEPKSLVRLTWLQRIRINLFGR